MKSLNIIASIWWIAQSYCVLCFSLSLTFSSSLSSVYQAITCSANLVTVVAYYYHYYYLVVVIYALSLFFVYFSHCVELVLLLWALSPFLTLRSFCYGPTAVQDDAAPGTQEYIMLRQDSIHSADIRGKGSPFRAKCHEIFCCTLKQVILKDNSDSEGLCATRPCFSLLCWCFCIFYLSLSFIWTYFCFLPFLKSIWLVHFLFLGRMCVL